MFKRLWQNFYAAAYQQFNSSWPITQNPLATSNRVTIWVVGSFIVGTLFGCLVGILLFV